MVSVGRVFNRIVHKTLQDTQFQRTKRPFDCVFLQKRMTFTFRINRYMYFIPLQNTTGFDDLK